MSHQLPDVQASQPDVTVGLSQVGVTSVDKLVKIARDDKRPFVLMAEFEIFVDLPSGRKGVDMSRNMQVIDEILEDAVSEPTYRVEDMCGDVAAHVLDAVGRFRDRVLEDLVDDLHVPAHVHTLPAARQIHEDLELGHQDERSLVIPGDLDEFVDARHADLAQTDSNVRLARLYVRQLVTHRGTRGTQFD